MSILDFFEGCTGNGINEKTIAKIFSGTETFEEGKEETNCKDEKININVEKKEHKINIEKFRVEPVTASCNQAVDVEIILENTGKKDEKAVVKVFNKELGLDFTSHEIELDSSKKNGRKNKIFFDFVLPKKLDKTNYLLNLVVDYGEEIEKTKEIRINNCENNSFKGSSIELLQKEINVNEDGDFVVPVKIKNNENERKESLIEIKDFILKTNSKIIILKPFEGKTIYLESSLEKKENGKFSGFVNLKEKGILIESRIVNLNYNVVQEEFTDNLYIAGSVFLLLLVLSLMFILL